MADWRDYYEPDFVANIAQYFAANSRVRRHQLHLSQARVADDMRGLYGFPWHQTVVAKIEKGERHVRLDEAFALCRIYGIDLDDMLRGRNLDMIRGGLAVWDTDDGTVRMAVAWPVDSNAPLVPIRDLLREADEKLRRDPLMGDAPRVKAWLDRVDDGEHPEEG